MSTFASFRKGGGHEDPVAPGKPDESYILTVLTATNKSRMPPKDAGDALPAAKIAVIERWINEGAKLDKGASPDADLLHELRTRWIPPAPLARYPYPVPVTAMTFTPDGKQIVTGGQHEITFWDASLGQAGRAPPHVRGTHLCPGLLARRQTGGSGRTPGPGG